MFSQQSAASVYKRASVTHCRFGLRDLDHFGSVIGNQSRALDIVHVLGNLVRDEIGLNSMQFKKTTQSLMRLDIERIDGCEQGDDPACSMEDRVICAIRSTSSMSGTKEEFCALKCVPSSALVRIHGIWLNGTLSRRAEVAK